VSFNAREPDDDDGLHHYDATWRNAKASALFAAVLAALVFAIALLV